MHIVIDHYESKEYIKANQEESNREAYLPSRQGPSGWRKKNSV